MFHKFKIACKNQAVASQSQKRYKMCEKRSKTSLNAKSQIFFCILLSIVTRESSVSDQLDRARPRHPRASHRENHLDPAKCLDMYPK